MKKIILSITGLSALVAGGFFYTYPEVKSPVPKKVLQTFEPGKLLLEANECEIEEKPEDFDTETAYHKINSARYFCDKADGLEQALACDATSKFLYCSALNNPIVQKALFPKSRNGYNICSETIQRELSTASLQFDAAAFKARKALMIYNTSYSQAEISMEWMRNSEIMLSSLIEKAKEKEKRLHEILSKKRHCYIE